MIVVWDWIWGSSTHRLKVVCPVWRLIVPILGRELLLQLAQRPNTKDWLGFQARPASSTLCFPSEEIQFQTSVCFLVKWIALVPQPKANLSYQVALRISNASSKSLFPSQSEMLQADASLVSSFANSLCFDGRSGSPLSFVHQRAAPGRWDHRTCLAILSARHPNVISAATLFQITGPWICLVISASAPTIFAKSSFGYDGVQSSKSGPSLHQVLFIASIFKSARPVVRGSLSAIQTSSDYPEV